MSGMDNHSHSWAARNPTRPILQPRPGGRKLTEAQKASRNIAREANNIKKKALDDDIKAFMENQAEKIEELARTHNTKPKRIKEMIGAESHYKKERKVNFHNALTHLKALEVNAGMSILCW